MHNLELTHAREQGEWGGYMWIAQASDACNAVPSKVCGVSFAVKVVLCSSNGVVFSVCGFGHSALQ